MNELHLFAGAGGGILAGHLLGRRCVCAVEFNAYARSVLVARQNDGTLPPFPIWDDVRTFDGRPWRGVVDVVAGGFPCQDISVAGKGDGLDGERSGLWSEFARIVREVRPRRVEVENSPMLTSRGLGRVLGDLAALGFDAEWGVLGADDCGAPHKRERIWIVANARGGRCYEQAEGQVELPRRAEAECSSSASGALAHVEELQRNGRDDHAGIGLESEAVSEFRDGSWPAHVAEAGSDHEQGQFSRLAYAQIGARPIQRQVRSRSHGGGWCTAEPDVGRVANELAAGMDLVGASRKGDF